MARSGRREGRFRSWERRALIAGLALLPVAAVAEDQGQRPKGRGFVWGAFVGGGRLGFPGGEGQALALGPVDGQERVPGMAGTFGVRSARVVRKGESVAGADRVVPLPRSEGAGSFSMHGGYAFDRRVALLLNVEFAGGLAASDFNHAVGGVALRFWPASRFWIEAGPAFGDLGYGDEHSVVRSQSITGTGFRGVAGVAVLRKPKWSLDLEVRYSRIAYDGFQATAALFGVSASMRPL